MGLATVKQKVSAVLKNKVLKYMTLAMVLALGGFFAFKLLKPVAKEVQSSKIAHDLKHEGVQGTYVKAGKSVWNKLRHIEDLDRENEKLMDKVAQLESELAETKATLDSERTKRVQDHLAKERKIETGSELGAVLSQIKYEVPTNLMPHQLYALAVGYIRKNENEQAAVILSNLVQLKEDKSYQRPEVYLLTAVAWYRLQHYKLSKDFLDQAEKTAKHNSAIYRQTQVWKSLVHQANQEPTVAQLIMLKLMDEFPHAEEVKWFNGQFTEANEKEVAKAEESKTEEHSREPAQKEDETEVKKDHLESKPEAHSEPKPDLHTDHAEKEGHH